jgi:N-carbamoylputrescine amidase
MLKKTLRTGIIQQHNTADIADNRNRLAQKMRELATQGAELIVNQELHDSLYFCQVESPIIATLP